MGNMKYIVHGSKNQNDSKRKTYFGASFLKRLIEVLTRFYRPVSGSSHKQQMRDQGLRVD